MSDKKCPYYADFKPTRFRLAEQLLRPTGVPSFSHATGVMSLTDDNAVAMVQADGWVVLDFGRETVGDFFLTACGAGAILNLLYSETYEGLFADDSYELSYYKYPRDQFELTDIPQCYKSNGRRAFRYLLISVAGSTASLTSAFMLHRHYPVTAYGSFCGEAKLTEYYRMAQETTKLCMQQFYEDGIKRDGLLWIGDFRIQQLCNFYLFGDSRLSADALKRIASTQFEDGSLPSCAVYGGGHQHPHVIDNMPGVTEGIKKWVLLNYCIDFICATEEYLMFTGDYETVAELTDCLFRLSEYITLQIETFPELFNQQSFITDENLRIKDTWRGIDCVLLFQYCEGLSSMQRLCKQLSIETSADYNARIEKVKTYIREAYGAENGLFFDYRGQTQLSYHSNAFAMRSGMLSAKQTEALKQLTTDDNIDYPIAGFMQYHVVDGLLCGGAVDAAKQLLERFWGVMREHGATTCWEKFDYKRPDNVLLNPVGSNCHGWSAGIAPLLGRHALGVTPLEPGFKAVQISPLYTFVGECQGSVPTPNGIIGVEITAQSISVSIPSGVKGVAILPDKSKHIFTDCFSAQF